jgi:ADP-ribose pyrophosphatase
MPNTLLIDEPNPWVTKSKKIVYDNAWIQVNEHQVIDPSGKDSIYGVVSPKVIAIGILPLDPQLNTWLVGQYRYAMQEYSWEIIEGGGKFGVDPIESGQRELQEEAGIIANKWTFLSTIHTSNCFTNEIAHLYIAQDLSFTHTSPDDSEKLQVVKMPFEEAYQLVLNGTIKDAMSIVSILRVKNMINEGLL